MDAGAVGWNGRPGGTYGNATRLQAESSCTQVALDYWAPTGSAQPIPCPSSGFFCPGASDVAAHAAAQLRELPSIGRGGGGS